MIKKRIALHVENRSPPEASDLSVLFALFLVERMQSGPTAEIADVPVQIMTLPDRILTHAVPFGVRAQPPLALIGVQIQITKVVVKCGRRTTLIASWNEFWSVDPIFDVYLTVKILQVLRCLGFRRFGLVFKSTRGYGVR